MRTFRVGERDLDAGCREIRLEGELDLSVADRFKARLDAALSDDVEVLVCLEECDFIDSTGIAVIVLAHRLMGMRGRRLAVCHPSPSVARLLELTGLFEEGLVFDSVAEALAMRLGHVVSRPLRANELAQGRSSSEAGSR
jgi:anti-anti-sigma factor